MSWTLVPKVVVGVAFHEGASAKLQGSVSLGKESKADPAAGPTHPKGTKKTQRDWCAKRQLLPQILEPCSNGAPFKPLTKLSCSACNTESLLSFWTQVKMGERQQDTRKQTTFSACTNQLHCSRRGCLGPQLLTTTPTQGARSWSQCLGRYAPDNDALHTQPSLRCHLLQHRRSTNRSKSARERTRSVTVTTDAAGHEGRHAVRRWRMLLRPHRTCAPSLRPLQRLHGLHILLDLPAGRDQKDTPRWTQEPYAVAPRQEFGIYSLQTLFPQTYPTAASTSESIPAVRPVRRRPARIHQAYGLRSHGAPESNARRPNTHTRKCGSAATA